MKIASFFILTALSLLYAGLTYAESVKYQAWQEALKQQNYIQIKLVYFQRLDGYIYQLLRRMTIDSQHDRAVRELLKRNGVKITVSTLRQMEANRDISNIPTLPTMPPLPGSSPPTVSAAATAPDSGSASTSAKPTPTP